MAVANSLNFTENDFFGSPLSIKRGNPNPLDTSEIYTAYADLEEYAKNDPTAYVGQICTVVSAEGDDDTGYTYTVSAFQIMDEEGTLKPVGTSLSDVFNSSDWNDLVERIDLIYGGDKVEGSVKNAIYMSKVTVDEESNGEGLTKYTFYQGYDITYEPVLGSDGNPILGTDGLPVKNAIYTKKKLTDISIDADIFVSDCKVIEVTGTPNPTTYTSAATSLSSAIAILTGSGITFSEGDTIKVADEYYKYQSGTWKTYDPNTYIDAEGTEVKSAKGSGSYLKMSMSKGDPVYIAVSDLAKGLASNIVVGAKKYEPDKDGNVNITEVSTDVLATGTNTLVIQCGDSAF